MTKVLLATVAILAFTAPSFAQQDKTTGQAPPSGASSFYLAQDTATMKCHVVNAQPAAGGTMKVVGTAHPTQHQQKQLWRLIRLASNEVTARVQRRHDRSRQKNPALLLTTDLARTSSRYPEVPVPPGS